MKTIGIIFTLLLSTAAVAKDACTLLVPFPPGGSTDIRARSMQLGNSNIDIDYKPGAFGSVAIDQMNKTKNSFLLSPAFMYSAKNPVKDLDIELNRVLFAVPLAIITIKDISLDDLADKPLKVGVPCRGCQIEGLAREIKNKNPNITVVPIPGDAKALPMIMNGDLDIYLGLAVGVNQWKKSYDNMKVLGTIPFNGTLKIRDIELLHLEFGGVFTKGKIDSSEKAAIENCIDKSVTSKEFIEQNKKNNLYLVNLSQQESQQILESYRKFLRKHGL